MGGNHARKEHKPKLLSPDIFRWGRGLPRQGVGAKKFDMSLETRGIKLFWWDIPGFCRNIPEVPEKFEKKKLVFNFCPLGKGCGSREGSSNRRMGSRLPSTSAKRIRCLPPPIHNCQKASQQTQPDFCALCQKGFFWPSNNKPSRAKQKILKHTLNPGREAS